MDDGTLEDAVSFRNDLLFLTLKYISSPKNQPIIFSFIITVHLSRTSFSLSDRICSKCHLIVTCIYSFSLVIFLIQDVHFGDLDLYSEDAWMSVSVSFNPYQCDLSPLTVSYSVLYLLMAVHVLSSTCRIYQMPCGSLEQHVNKARHSG